MKIVPSRIFNGLFVIGLTSLLMVACGDSSSKDYTGGGSSGGTGTVSLSLTDNSDGYNSVVISVLEVGFVTNDSATTYYNSADFETLPAILDVLELPGASTYYMGDIEVELPASGEPLCFNQIRMVLAADPKKDGDPIDPFCADEPFCNYVVLEGDDTEQWLQTPSGSESGLKINAPKDFCLQEGDDTLSVVIEFDPSTAIVEQGNGGFLLKPTGIKLIEGDFSGAPESYIDGTAVVPVTKTGDVCDVYEPPPTVTVNAYNSAVVDPPPSSSVSVLMETPLPGSEVDPEVCKEWCLEEADPGACEADCTAGTSPECFYSGYFKLLLGDKGTYDLEATWDDFIATEVDVAYNSSVLMLLE